MEKPTGVIQKIIESLQQINTLDVYSPIEKDIILHNLRAAYMIFLNISTKETNTESRIEQLFLNEGEEEKEEEVMEEEPKIEQPETENVIQEELKIEEQIEIFDEEIIDEEIVEEEPVEEKNAEFIEVAEEEVIEVAEEEAIEVVEAEVIEVAEEAVIEEEIAGTPNVPDVPNLPNTQESQILHDDISEFIPEAQPQATLLFEETTVFKPEKKSLNDLLTEKKDDNSLGTKFQQSHIPDLTKAIAINEKFSFIKELFHNSGVDFSNAIQKLNECENIDVAFKLMEVLKHQYLWDTTSSSYLTLCDLVRRRFL